jgi:hypothetical protein
MDACAITYPPFLGCFAITVTPLLMNGHKGYMTLCHNAITLLVHMPAKCAITPLDASAVTYPPFLGCFAITVTPLLMNGHKGYMTLCHNAITPFTAQPSLVCHNPL